MKSIVSALLAAALLFSASCSAPTQEQPPRQPEPEVTAPQPTSRPTPPAPAARQVYVTRTGEKYHLDGCQYLRRSQLQMGLDAARAAGYSACSRCW